MIALFLKGEILNLKDNYTAHRAEWSHHTKCIMYFALMPFFRAKAKFVSLMPHDLRGMKSQSMTVCYAPGEVFLDKENTYQFEKNKEILTAQEIK